MFEPLSSGEAVIQAMRDSFTSQKQTVERAAGQITDEKLREPLHPETNSVAVIMKHIAGNLRSRFTEFLNSDGEKPWRNRDQEFVDEYNNRAELLADWEAGWESLFQVLRTLRPEQLTVIVPIRGEPHTVLLALTRSLSHVSYHVGQIVMVSRIHAGETWETMTIPRGGSEEYNKTHWHQET